jgi:hypothetical protein
MRRARLAGRRDCVVGTRWLLWKKEGGGVDNQAIPSAARHGPIIILSPSSTCIVLSRLFSLMRQSFDFLAAVILSPKLALMFRIP